MRTFDWLNNEIIANGLLCEEYTEKWRNARSKKQIVDICSDANGLKFLPEMRELGHPLPYDVIREEFEDYINGNYTSVIKSSNGNVYSTQIYCLYNNDIKPDVVAICLLGCRGNVFVAPNSAIQIIADQNTRISLFCPESSQVDVILYPNAKVDLYDHVENITIWQKIRMIK